MSAAASRPSFIGAFGGEVIKVTRQLSVWLMLLGALVLLGVFVLAISGAANLKPMLESDPTLWAYDKLLTFGTIFQIGSGIFLLIVGARLIGMEYSAGTIRIAFARGFGRFQFLLAKVLTLAAMGVALLAGYVLLAGTILALMILSLHGSLDPVSHISAAFWQDAERWAAIQGVSMGLAILVAAAAAGVGRSLAFAVAAALAWYPVDNFTTILESLGARSTGHLHPWVDISTYQLAPNLNVLLGLWEPSHQSRPVLAAPLVPVDLTHAAVVTGLFALAFALVATFRAVRPDVLE